MTAQRRKRSAGFTLLETLVAIMLLSLLSIMAFQIMNGALRTESWGKQRAAQFESLQRTITLLHRDFTQMLAKQVAGGGGVLTLTADSLSFFSQDSASAWVISRQGELISVRWHLHDHILWRQSGAPDALNTAEVPLLSNVDAIQWRFYHQGWQDNWTDTNALPQGILLTIRLGDGKIVQYIFLLTGATIMQTKEKKAPQEQNASAESPENPPEASQ